MSNLNLGISMAILVLFFIIIGIGYVYVDESRKNNQEARDAIVDAKEAIIIVNKTQAAFLEEWKEKQAIDNIRFNKTLDGLNDTYDLITENQKRIINFSNIGSHSSQTNLNLTKFNRASLVDTNHVMREIAKQLNITLPPFDPSRLN